MRLGDWLVREGLVAPEGVQEALESQVVHGGRLGTNLVELGLLSEEALARALGALLRCSYAAGEMKPDPAALALFEPGLLDDKDVIPMRLEPTRLLLAVVDLTDLSALDAIAFRSGRKVVPVVIPEFRMHQLLRRHAKAFRPLRAIDMGVARPSKTLAAAAGPGELGSPAADLMDEDEFQTLYARALSGGTAATEPDEDELEEIELMEEDELTVDVAVEEEVTPAPEPITEPAAPSAPRLTLDDDVGALDFAEAQALLARSSDREEIASGVLRYAIGKWRRALLFSVQGPLLLGWRGIGEGIRTREEVQRIALPLQGDSTFKLVRDTRSHYVGPMKRDALSAVFYRMLGGGVPTTVVLLPLLARGRLAHVLYIDDGAGRLTSPDIGELLILSQGVARSYEALIEQRARA